MENTTDAATAARAEALAQLSADLIQVLFNTQHAAPDMPWTDMVIATTAALRGLAAKQCIKDPALSKAHAGFLLISHFSMAMALPDKLVQIVTDEGDTTGGPDTAEIIPLKRH